MGARSGIRELLDSDVGPRCCVGRSSCCSGVPNFLGGRIEVGVRQSPETRPRRVQGLLGWLPPADRGTLVFAHSGSPEGTTLRSSRSSSGRCSPCSTSPLQVRPRFGPRTRPPRPVLALARISHTHKKHRSPGDVKFMYGMNLTRFPTEDRCPHTVSPFPWHFKGARGAG